MNRFYRITWQWRAQGGRWGERLPPFWPKKWEILFKNYKFEQKNRQKFPKFDSKWPKWQRKELFQQAVELFPGAGKSSTAHQLLTILAGEEFYPFQKSSFPCFMFIFELLFLLFLFSEGESFTVNLLMILYLLNSNQRGFIV